MDQKKFSNLVRRRSRLFLDQGGCDDYLETDEGASDMVFLDFLKIFDLDPAVFCPFDIADQNDDSDSVNSETSNESIKIDPETIQPYDPVSSSTTWPSSSETDTNEINSGPAETEACQTGSGNIKCTQCDFSEPLEDLENGSGSFICSAKHRAIDDIYSSASGCISYYSSEQISFDD